MTVNDDSQVTSHNPVLVDLGKHSRKRVKRLRRGKGRLMADVHDALEDLRESGQVGADAQTVVVIVRQKPRRRKRFPFRF